MNPNHLKAYEVLKEEELQDIHSKGWLLRHKKTGARVMLIENSDENKVFNIAFRTPPKNSTKLLHTKTIIKSCKKRTTKNINVNTKKSQRNVSKYGGH